MRPAILGTLVVAALGVAYWLGSRTESEHDAVSETQATRAGTAMSQEGDAGSAPHGADAVPPSRAFADAAEAPAAAMSVAAPSVVSPWLDRQLLTGQYLNENVQPLIEGKDFAKALAQTRRDADAGALRTTESYRELVETSLAGAPGGPLVDDIACTSRLCLVSVLAPAPMGSQTVAHGRQAWTQALLEGTSGTPLKIGAMSSVDVVLPGKRVQTRMAFALGTSGFIVR